MKLLKTNVFILLAAGALVACENDDAESATNTNSGDGDGDNNNSGDGDSDAGGDGDDSNNDEADSGAPPAEEPIYLIQTAIYGPEETLNYVLLRNELDLNITTEDLDTAREFDGYTGVEVIGGYVYAGSGSEPFVYRYSVADDLTWVDEGDLNFGAYPMDEWNYMNFYFQSVKDEDSVYFFYGEDKASRVHWSPSEFTIKEDFPDSALPIPEEGWFLANGGNRTGISNFAGAVVQPFFQRDADYNPASQSWLAVYDPDTHEEIDVLESDCPELEQVTQDEDGNMYFSTTYYTSVQALFGQMPAACVVKVKPDGTLDESFAPNDLTEWTGGFYGVNFRYLRDGKAVANVLHDDRLTGVDFDGEITEDVWLATEAPDVWELHLIDLEAGTSQIVSEGFEAGHDLGSYTTYMNVDDRTFIVVQLDSETTRSAMYELDLDTASVTLVGETEGDIWTVERVR
jgi:hypothetical protein